MWWIIKNVNCTQHKTQETTGENLAENPELTRRVTSIIYCTASKE